MKFRKWMCAVLAGVMALAVAAGAVACNNGTEPDGGSVYTYNLVIS